MLDHDGLIPAFIDLTDGKTHEVNIGRTIKLPKGSILTMDLGYIDYQWFDDLNGQGVFFVTRVKKNMCYRVFHGTHPTEDGVLPATKPSS